MELTCPTGEHIEDGNCVIDEVNCAENYEIVDGICYNILIDTFKESLGTSDIVFEDITSTLDLTGLGIEKVELFTNSEITDGYIYTAMFNGDFQDNGVWEQSGEHVFLGDFSALNTIGTYYYYIDGSLPGQLIGDSTVDYFSSGTYNLGLQYDNGKRASKFIYIF